MRPRPSLIVLALMLTPPLFVAGQQKDKPSWPPSEHIAATEALPPEEQLKKFHLPPGFEIQLVAAEPGYPQADQHRLRRPRPALGHRDGRISLRRPGRSKGRDAVKILEDFGPDGRARKITTFADGLNIPIGVLPTSDKAGHRLQHSRTSIA